MIANVANYSVYPHITQITPMLFVNRRNLCNLWIHSPISEEGLRYEQRDSIEEIKPR